MTMVLFLRFCSFVFLFNLDLSAAADKLIAKEIEKQIVHCKKFVDRHSNGTASGLTFLYYDKKGECIYNKKIIFDAQIAASLAKKVSRDPLNQAMPEIEQLQQHYLDALLMNHFSLTPFPGVHSVNCD
jgi:parvulin-like peptidyl-prolyl isomerase